LKEAERGGSDWKRQRQREKFDQRNSCARSSNDCRKLVSGAISVSVISQSTSIFACFVFTNEKTLERSDIVGTLYTRSVVEGVYIEKSEVA
jgi:hypothetical protein